LASAAPFEKASTKSAAIGGLLASGALDQVISAGLFDVQAELAAGTSEFPSFCFAIATGGGKTKLMGACIAYLFQTKGWKNFFVLSKGGQSMISTALTILSQHQINTCLKGYRAFRRRALLTVTTTLGLLTRSFSPET
jgi:hypothetical protein